MFKFTAVDPNNDALFGGKVLVIADRPSKDDMLESGGLRFSVDFIEWSTMAVELVEHGTGFQPQEAVLHLVLHG